MSAAEEAEAAAAEKASRRAAAAAARQQEQATLLTRQQEVEAKLGDLRQRRQAQAASCETALVQRYEQVRKTRGGRAVVLAEGGTCQGCRVSLGPSEMQRLRLGAEVVTCSNCGRILYLP
jgi:predicted  nucleic acid-binding Zn-ribbon protein